MAVTSWVGQGAVTLKIDSTQYEAKGLVGFEEITESSGGQKIELADRSVIRTVEQTTVVAVRLTMVQSLDAADLFRYLRETAPTSATLYFTGTSSTTEGTSNPKWTYSVTGWTAPKLSYAPGTTPTPESTLTVTGAATVDVTP